MAKLYLCGPVGDVTYSRERAVCGGGGCDCVSCSITMVHCEVGELDFVSKCVIFKGDHTVGMIAKALRLQVLNFNKTHILTGCHRIPKGNIANG